MDESKEHRPMLNGAVLDNEEITAVLKIREARACQRAEREAAEKAEAEKPATIPGLRAALLGSDRIVDAEQVTRGVGLAGKISFEAKSPVASTDYAQATPGRIWQGAVDRSMEAIRSALNELRSLEDRDKSIRAARVNLAAALESLR